MNLETIIKNKEVICNNYYSYSSTNFYYTLYISENAQDLIAIRNKLSIKHLSKIGHSYSLIKFLEHTSKSSPNYNDTATFKFWEKQIKFWKQYTQECVK